MKKHIYLIAGMAIMIWPRVALAEAVKGYVITSCDYTTSQYQEAVCNDTSLNCGSNSIFIGSGATYCGAFDVEGNTDKMLICFDDPIVCKNLSACGENYNGLKKKLSIHEISLDRQVQILNYPFFTCCQTCRGTTDWYDVTGGTTPYQRIDYNTCSTDGVCGAGNGMPPRFRCPENYYSQNGFTISGIAPTCLSCPEKTGVDAAQSDAASGQITDCYVGPGVTLTDPSGQYVFTQKCNYSN